MSINLGSNQFGLYLGSTKIGEAYVGDVKVYSSTPPFPARTLRCKYLSGCTPTVGSTRTLVDASENIWDIYAASTDYANLFHSDGYCLVSVIEANTTGVTNMNGMFNTCINLTSVVLFDTSSVTSMSTMFLSCIHLTNIPLFNTSSVTNMSSMFEDCSRVESGALALYNQASSQANPPLAYSKAFKNCGVETVTGAAELAQIPSSWGGTGI